MSPYIPGKPIDEVKRELGLDRVVKLASNENPFGPSPLAIEAVQRAANELHIYPDGAAYHLRAAISAKFGMPESQILLGNGSDELIHMIGQVLLDGPDDEVIVGFPSFVRYDASAFITGAKLVRVPLDADYRHDLEAMAAAITPRTKLIFIANPNNPTGTIVRQSELEAFLGKVPAGVAVVLDEAYFEFASGEPGYPVSVDLVKAGYPVIGLRTFSKTYGLAGIRVGYGFASAEFCDGFERAREPFNVNSLAQVAAVAALGDDEHLRKTVEHNRAGLVRMADALRRVGASPCESFANFVFVDMHRPAGPLFQEFLRRGVIVRSGESLGAPTCLRVSVGTDEEIDAFIEALNAIMAVPA